MSDEEFISLHPDVNRITNIRWLWSRLIPAGGLVEIIGEEDKGKGFIACDLLAKLTRGKLEGCYYDRPVNAAVLAYEDDQAEWDKRLAVAGANLKRIYYPVTKTGAIPDLSEQAFSFIKYCKTNRIRFIYIDQLLDHVGLETDTYNTKKVRNVLLPFHAMLVKNNITALATLHPNKRGETARARLSGSSALWQPCRSAFYLAEHPDDEDTRVLVQIKNNRAMRKAPTIEFQIVDSGDILRVRGKKVSTGKVVITNRHSSLGIDDILGASKGTGREARLKDLDKALAEALSHNGGVSYMDLKGMEPFYGMSYNRLRRSLERIGGEISSHSPGHSSNWYIPRKGSQGRRASSSRGRA